MLPKFLKGHVSTQLSGGTATEEGFAEDKLKDRPWAQIYDKEYHLGYIN